jgi:hypothetical protein
MKPVLALWAAVGLVVAGGSLVAFAAVSGPSEPAPEATHSEMPAIVGISPARPSPGDTVSVTVENTSDRIITYGLEFRIERLESGDWVDVTDAQSVLAGSSPAWRGPAIALSPGESAAGYRTIEPGGGEDLPDTFQIAADAEPGVYRVVKTVVLRGPGEEQTSPIDATASFEIGHGSSS